jgi:hypothetical protein
MPEPQGFVYLHEETDFLLVIILHRPEEDSE